MPKRWEYIPIKPLSVNEAWKGRRFKTDKYKNYINAVNLLLPRSFVLPEPPYKIYFEFGFSSKLSDWDNPIKQIQDIICKKYSFDDKLIREGNVKTFIVPKGKEYIKWRIEHLEM